MATPNYDHGILYSPSDEDRKPEFDLPRLRHQGCHYVRVQWLDFTNQLRLRVLPLGYFQSLLQTSRPGVTMVQVAFGMVVLSLAEGFSPIGEYLYIFDLESWRPCPYAPGHISVFGYFQYKYPIAGSISVPLCPRRILGRLVEEAKLADIQFLVGLETEFILLEEIEPVKPSGNHDWSSTRGLLPGNKNLLVLQEIADAIRDSHIRLEMYHPEAAPGQYEMVTGPLLPLQAADAQVHIREIVHNIARKHDLYATFAPRVFLSGPGSSSHAHISVHRISEDIKRESESLSSLEQQFLSGVLTHMRALPALTLPTPASYKRVLDGVWSGGTYINWGSENREAPVRLCHARSTSSRNFEGIVKELPLTIKDCSGDLTAVQMDEAGRKALGIENRLPLSWEEGRKAFVEDQVISGFFGEEFVKKYLAVNKLLGDILENSDDGDEAKKLTRLVRYY
ncbi:hypothetical protein DL96DRAFT_1670912 [Flagelloscypha sp. PMI_526]|nr:hypothetical protein DL96DRAFT_1670912 [Flagelloscypha sp. PMI_526]